MWKESEFQRSSVFISCNESGSKYWALRNKTQWVPDKFDLNSCPWIHLQSFIFMMLLWHYIKPYLECKAALSNLLSLEFGSSLWPFLSFRTLQIWSVPLRYPLAAAPRRWMACSVLSLRPWITARLRCVRCCRRKRRRLGVGEPWAWTMQRSSRCDQRISGRGVMLTLWMSSRRIGNHYPACPFH